MELVYRAALGLFAVLDLFTAGENLAAIAAWSQREVEFSAARIGPPWWRTGEP